MGNATARVITVGASGDWALKQASYSVAMKNLRQGADFVQAKDMTLAVGRSIFEELFDASQTDGKAAVMRLFADFLNSADGEQSQLWYVDKNGRLDYHDVRAVDFTCGLCGMVQELPLPSRSCRGCGKPALEMP